MNTDLQYGGKTTDIRCSEDAFHRGDFRVLQPADRGHRSGSDALLIAAALPKNAAGLLADLGSGAGVAAFAALNANPLLSATLVENDPTMASLARRSAKLPANINLVGRVQVIEADVELSGRQREESGLLPASHDFVVMNPPYNHPGQRSSPDAMRAKAHMIGAGGLEPWMRTAAAILKPGGMLSMIYRTEKIGDVIACSQGRFGDLAIVPVHARAHEPASRILVRMIKGSRAPLSIRPSLVMHEADNTPTAIADALLNGAERVNFG